MTSSKSFAHLLIVGIQHISQAIMQIKANLDNTRAMLSCHLRDDDDNKDLDIASNEAALTVMSTCTFSQEQYDSSKSTLLSDTGTTPASQSFAVDKSSSSTTERAKGQQHQQQQQPNVAKSFEIFASNGSEVSPLEPQPVDLDDNESESSAMKGDANLSYSKEEEKVNTLDESNITPTPSNDDDKVVVSAEWTISLANAVAGIEDELNTALADAAESGRKKASMEEELDKARVAAELDAKKLRKRLEEKIQDVLMLELELENAQDNMKEREKEYISEKDQLTTKMEMELEHIRNERTTLLVKVAGLEEENAILCAKLLGGSGKKRKTRAAAGFRRRLSPLFDKLKLYRERLWKRRNRGVPL